MRKPTMGLMGALLGVALMSVPSFFIGRTVYRIRVFSAALDRQVELIETLSEMMPVAINGQSGSEVNLLRNVWSNVCFGAYYMPDSPEDLEAMHHLTNQLEKLVARASPATIIESVRAAYDLLHKTGYNPDFIRRHREAELEWIEAAM